MATKSGYPCWAMVNVVSMERIFRDFETQISAAKTRELELDAREVRRAEYAQIRQLDRLAAQVGQQLNVAVAGAHNWTGKLVSLGSDWLQLKGRAENILIPYQAVIWWEGGSSFSQNSPTDVRRKLNLAYALRALSRARLPVTVLYRSECASSQGTIEQVGQDFFELALHSIEGGYRSRSVLGQRVMGFDQLAALCSPLS